MTAAALGTTLTLASLDGDEELDIPAGTQPGQVVTMRGKGVTHLRASGRGDLIVHIDVQTPTRLDEEQERLLRELAVRRGEERPEARLAPAHGGIFSRLLHAWSPVMVMGVGTLFALSFDTVSQAALRSSTG